MSRWAIAFLILLVGQIALAQVPQVRKSLSSRDVELFENLPEAVTKKPAPRARPKAAQPWLQNPDFEDIGVDGAPAEWFKFREGFVDNDPALARNGSQSVRASYLFGWSQPHTIPVSPYQSFAIAGYANREFDDERPAIRGVYFDELGQYLKEYTKNSPVSTAAGIYSPFWAVQEVPPASTHLDLYLRGAYAHSWIRFDDLALFTEQLCWEPGPTGTGWEVGDGATTSPGELNLPPGAVASQLVATGTDNQAYFIWAKYTASQPATITIRETWVPRSSSEAQRTTETVHSLTVPGGTVLSDPGRMTGSASGKTSVTLSNSSDGTVIFEQVRRGFAKVDPPTLVAGPASPDGPLQLTAAWPEHLTTATVEILNSGGDVVSTPTATMIGTTVRAEWMPDTFTSGPAAARFTLLAGDGAIAVVTRPFHVVREDAASPVVAPYHHPEFIRGAWLFTHRDSTPAQSVATIEAAVQDGFNYAIILCRPDQLSTIRAAAEGVNLPYVIFLPEATNVFYEYAAKRWFSKADYLHRLRALFAPVIGSPLFQGPYIVDEPYLPEAVEPLRRANLSVGQDEFGLGTPFSVLLSNAPAPDVLQVQPPAALVDVYPFHSSVPSSYTDALLDAVPVMNALAAGLETANRDLYILPQAFAEHGVHQFHPVPLSMHAAQLGAAVLAGARGIIPFTYSSFDAIDGLREPGLMPSPRLSTYVHFNSVIARIGSQLLDLGTPQLIAAPRPFALSTATASNGDTYAIALNADDITTRTLLLQVSPTPSAPVLDLVSETPVPRRPDAQLELTLSPGGWAVMTLAQGTITGTNAVPAHPPITTYLNLPLTHAFTATRPGGDGQPVLGLELNATGDTLAVSGGVNYFEPTLPLFYHLQGGGVVTREDGILRFPSEHNRFTSSDLHVVASSFLGFRMHNAGNHAGAPARAFLGRTGGAFDVVESASSTWVSMQDFGIRQIQDVGGTLQSVSTGRAVRGSYGDLFGPFADGSVTAIVKNFGVSNIKPGQLNEFNHRYSIVSRVDNNASLNARGFLAVPRHQHGVALFQLDENGEPLHLLNFANEAIDATAVAWVFDRLLAVADGARGVHFYRFSGSAPTFAGTWRPPTSTPFYLRSIAAANGRLAVGLFDGRVFVADASVLEPAPAAAQDWQYLQ